MVSLTHSGGFRASGFVDALKNAGKFAINPLVDIEDDSLFGGNRAGRILEHTLEEMTAPVSILSMALAPLTMGASVGFRAGLAGGKGAQIAAARGLGAKLGQSAAIEGASAAGAIGLPEVADSLGASNQYVQMGIGLAGGFAAPAVVGRSPKLLGTAKAQWERSTPLYDRLGYRWLPGDLTTRGIKRIGGTKKEIGAPRGPEDLATFPADTNALRYAKPTKWQGLKGRVTSPAHRGLKSSPEPWATRENLSTVTEESLNAGRPPTRVSFKPNDVNQRAVRDAYEGIADVRVDYTKRGVPGEREVWAYYPKAQREPVLQKDFRFGTYRQDHETGKGLETKDRQLIGWLGADGTDDLGDFFDLQAQMGAIEPMEAAFAKRFLSHMAVNSEDIPMILTMLNKNETAWTGLTQSLRRDPALAGKDRYGELYSNYRNWSDLPSHQRVMDVSFNTKGLRRSFSQDPITPVHELAHTVYRVLLTKDEQALVRREYLAETFTQRNRVGATNRTDYNPSLELGSKRDVERAERSEHHDMMLRRNQAEYRYANEMEWFAEKMVDHTVDRAIKEAAKAPRSAMTKLKHGTQALASTWLDALNIRKVRPDLNEDDIISLITKSFSEAPAQPAGVRRRVESASSALDDLSPEQAKQGRRLIEISGKLDAVPTSAPLDGPTAKEKFFELVQMLDDNQIDYAEFLPDPPYTKSELIDKLWADGEYVTTLAE